MNKTLKIAAVLAGIASAVLAIVLVYTYYEDITEYVGRLGKKA